MPNISLSVPHYKQEFGYSCVAACVRMVLAFHGRTLSEAELRELLDTRSSGTPARNVQRVASLGFDVLLGPCSMALLADVLTAGRPHIIFLETCPLDYWQLDCAHVVVVTGVDDVSVFVNDPYFDAPQRTSLAHFQSAWAAMEHLTAILAPRP